MGNNICKNFNLLTDYKKPTIIENSSSNKIASLDKRKFCSRISSCRVEQSSRAMELFKANHEVSRETKSQGNERSQRDIVSPGNGIVVRNLRFPATSLPLTTTQQTHTKSYKVFNSNYKLKKLDISLVEYLQIKNKNLRDFNSSLMSRILDLLKEKELLEKKINSLI